MARPQRVPVIAAIVVSLTTTACGGLRQYSQYEDLNTARADGAIERGWLPDWIPENAVDIHEFHDLDTAQHAISFRLEAGREFVWPEHCSVSNGSSGPRFKTKLFPRDVHKLPKIKNCRGYYVVQDPDEIIHMWSPP